jgi:hypothetical protein
VAVVEFKDLCIDAGDPVLLGQFWAGALDLQFHLQGGGDAYLTGPTPQHTIWVNAVPEAKSVKHRMHLDVTTLSVERLVRNGASVIDASSFNWTVMNDPEGGEFCAFLRSELPQHVLHAVVIDCASAESSATIAQWWGSAFAAEVVHDPRGFSSVVRINGAPFDSLDFIPVPEPKGVKNRLHIDVTSAAIDTVLAHGATLVRGGDEEISWSVCADPDGNEFCVFTPR